MKNLIAKNFQNIKKPMGNMLDKPNNSFPLINLGIGDIDINTDHQVIEKAMTDAKNGYTHYTDPYGLRELREAIAIYHKKNFQNYDFNYNNVLITTSALHGMYLLFKCILDPKDEVILLAPFFPVYKSQVELSGGVAVMVETKLENNFQLVKEDIEKNISNKTKAIILNSPGNPTGVCYSKESLEIIRDLSEKYGFLVIADDVYDFYSYKSNFIPPITIEGMKDKCITLCSFSKNFAMTGWRIGYAISEVPKLLDTMEFLNESIVYSPPTPSQRAALHALNDFERIRDNNVPIFKKRIEYAYERVAHIKEFNIFESQGGIYLFIDISGTGMNASEFSAKLLAETNVLVIDGTPFGASNFIRIACSVDLETLKKAFDRIDEFVKKINL
ncbi:aminotransferase class I/II-fold pyridoxal phosphate-dependent enzyme [Fusobacterium sp. PH5-44]|uniref:aminotransferase class I/II-fold pyridoxal phosphate-dependent enzyme n=1 Tax=unclassified Fusobacterium TaxID=2648384 RepID=UPI003D1FA369